VSLTPNPVRGEGKCGGNLLNLTTYFKRKIRAGPVGSKGVAPLIDRLAAQVQRVHLIGHSFGGRLVTAAAADSTTTTNTGTNPGLTSGRADTSKGSPAGEFTFAYSSANAPTVQQANAITNLWYFNHYMHD